MKRNFFAWLSILSITFLSVCIDSASSPPAFSAKTVENALTFWQENGVRDYEFSWTRNGATPNCSVNVHVSHRSGVSDVNLEYDGSYAESSEADRIAEMDTVEKYFKRFSKPTRQIRKKSKPETSTMPTTISNATVSTAIPRNSSIRFLGPGRTSKTNLRWEEAEIRSSFRWKIFL